LFIAIFGRGLPLQQRVVHCETLFPGNERFWDCAQRLVLFQAEDVKTTGFRYRGVAAQNRTIFRATTFLPEYLSVWIQRRMV